MVLKKIVLFLFNTILSSIVRWFGRCWSTSFFPSNTNNSGDKKIRNSFLKNETKKRSRK
jgi:hypothetical protein